VRIKNFIIPKVTLIIPPSLYKEKIEKYSYLDDDNLIRTKLVGNTVELIRSNEVSASLTNIGNGYIAKYNSSCSSAQDYYVCLDYAQAEYLYLVLKEALGKNVKRVKE